MNKRVIIAAGMILMLIAITVPVFAEGDIADEVKTSAASDVLTVSFKVREQDAAKITEGAEAKISVDAFPDQTFEGIVEKVSEGVAKIRLDNSKRNLSGGQIVRIECAGSMYLAEISSAS